jgi:hypothetical protein
LISRIQELYEASRTAGLSDEDRKELANLIEDLSAARSDLADQIALQKAVSRAVDPAKTPLIRPEDRPEFHLERLLSHIQLVLAKVDEISQDVPKNRQNS